VITPIPNNYLFPFDSGNGVAFSGEGFYGLNPGANNSFAGNGRQVDAAVAGFTLAELCLTGDLTLADADPTDFPMTLEFRIENGNCGFFPCPWTDFYTVVNANGTYSLGGLLSTGNTGASGPFDPAGPDPFIILSLANFTGTPTVGTPVVTYANVEIVGNTCEPIPNCVPTAGEWGLISLAIAFLSFGLVFLRTKSWELELG